MDKTEQMEKQLEEVRRQAGGLQECLAEARLIRTAQGRRTGRYRKMRPPGKVKIRQGKIYGHYMRKWYQVKLHGGKVEVMILAQEGVRADLVILDDNAAKKTAKYLRLTVTAGIQACLKLRATR